MTSVPDEKDTLVGTNTMRGAAEQAGHQVREFVDTTTREACNAAVTLEKKIRSNPVTASMIALGVGFLLGPLFRRS